MQTRYTITEAKAKLSAIIAAIEETGQSVTIMRGKKPVVEIAAPVKPKRKGCAEGFYEGQVWLADDWDAPWPEDIQRALYMID